MGELITKNDIWLHLPTAFPLYPYRMMTDGGVSRAVGEWYTRVKRYEPTVRKRLQSARVGRLALTHPLAQAAQTLDPPCRLWFAGSMGDPPYLVVVGPRNPSPYAVTITKQLVSALAPRVTVVSGMAYGIDTIALQAAVAAGGRGIAISPSGVETPVPAGSVAFVRAMVRGGRGAILSEYLFTTQLGPLYFLHRNRILAGVATVVLVIEAALRSGTMTTARLALDQGATVAVVPADIDRATAGGSNALLRDGAQVVLGPADLASLLGIVWKNRVYPPQYQPLVRAIERGCTSIEGLAEVLRCDLKSLARLLLAAEQDSIVSRDHNGAIIIQQG